MHWTKIIILLLVGLSFFLIGIGLLSKTIKKSFAKKAKAILKRYTTNIFYSIIAGMFLTIILDSSSAVIILAIVFINAGSLNFKQTAGIILGSNIGTTFSSQLIALDIYRYSYLGILIGILILIIAKNRKWNTIGKVITYFGLVFFGLFIMEQSVIPLKGSGLFNDWILSLENNHILGAIIGGLITIVIQSSSATVALAIIMTKQNIIASAVGISIMLGAELGTCFNTALATIGGSREAVKAAIFHATFNLLTIIIALIFFEPFVKMVIDVTESTGIGSTIPNAHMIFNILGVLAVLPLIGLIEKFLQKMLPTKQYKLNKNE